MKNRILHFFLLISSLFGYLEWGGGNKAFLFQIEGEILQKIPVDPISVLHPFTILPMLGQVCLLICLFPKKPSRILVFSGIGLIGMLFAMLLLIGFLGFQWQIILSTLPFWLGVIFRFRIPF